MTSEEVAALKAFVARRPMAGDLIVGSGGARKVRFAKGAGGKSGGYRVVTYFGGEDIPVFLMDVYAKGEKSNLSEADKNALRAKLETFARDYRESAQRLAAVMEMKEVR